MSRTNPSDNETFTEISLEKDSKSYCSKDLNSVKKRANQIIFICQARLYYPSLSVPFYSSPTPFLTR